MEKLLEVINLKKSFGANPVLKGINFSVCKGEVIALIGSSGSGKSTLLRCLNLLEKADEGQIRFKNQDLSENPTLIKHFGMVFQQFNLFNNMNVLKNCVIAQEKVLKKNSREAKEKALYYLGLVGMQEYVEAKPVQLSGGQKQRVAIARALAMEPQIILFDEPTSALDPEMVGEVLQTMKTLAEMGFTMIVVTHEMEFAHKVAHRVLFIDKGIILEDLPSKQFFSNPTHARTREFLKLPNVENDL